MADTNQPYDIVIGLEVHVQLLTRSKLFCSCGTKFGLPPNTQTCPVCIGMPGVLPVMNRRAVELAQRAAVALDCHIAPFTKWDRKHYYYPDLPKGFQTSQYDLPLSHDGYLEIRNAAQPPSATNVAQPPSATNVAQPPSAVRAAGGTAAGGTAEGGCATPTKRIGIIRAHLEEDAGKSMHDEVSGTADSRIDLNRAGTPLLEIVSQPDLRSSVEAGLYLRELKLLLTYLGVSDCNMQEGSLRVDANINLHVHTPQGKVATPIVEVKNMNSFRAVEKAMAYEALRQYREWKETGHKLGDVPKQTRGWDESAELTRPQRSKEESSDYRYFPEPDLVPIVTTEEQVERIRASLGELPAQLRSRLERTYGITPYDSDVIVNQGRPFVDYYVDLASRSGDGKSAANWMQQDVLRWLNDQQFDIARFPVPSAELAALLGKVRAGQLDTSRAREVLAGMIESGRSTEAQMQALGIQQIDDSEIDTLCRELLAANPKVVAEIKEGKTKGVGALIGQAKKQNPNANPNRVRQRCLELIEQM